MILTLKVSRERVVTDLSACRAGAEQGDLRQAEGQVHPQWLHRG